MTIGATIDISPLLSRSSATIDVGFESSRVLQELSQTGWHWSSARAVSGRPRLGFAIKPGRTALRIAGVILLKWVSPARPMAVWATERLSRIGLGPQAALLHGSLDVLENTPV